MYKNGTNLSELFIDLYTEFRTLYPADWKWVQEIKTREEVRFGYTLFCFLFLFIADSFPSIRTPCFCFFSRRHG